MVNRTAVNISWIYPLDVNNPDDMSLLGGMIKGFYVIVFAPDSLHPPIVHRNYQGSIGTQYWDIVGNLTPGTTYHAQVKAFTKKGDGKPSVAYIFTVPKEDSRKSLPCPRPVSDDVPISVVRMESHRFGYVIERSFFSPLPPSPTRSPAVNHSVQPRGL